MRHLNEKLQNMGVRNSYRFYWYWNIRFIAISNGYHRLQIWLLSSGEICYRTADQTSAESTNFVSSSMKFLWHRA